MIVKLMAESFIPQSATPGSSGVDLQYSGIEGIIIPAGMSALIPTGLRMEIPEGYEMQIRPRSGLALKYSITVLNTPGTIDCDYRNEIGVILINHGKNPFIVNPGDRIAQGVFAKVKQVTFRLVEKLNETERSGGFGSTGK